MSPMPPESSHRSAKGPVEGPAEGPVVDGPIRAVIFDLDGVLVSSLQMHYTAFRRTFEAEGRDFPIEEYRSFAIGASREDVIRRVMGDLPPETFRRLMAAKEAHVRGYLEERAIDVIPGALEFVRSVRARGIRTAVASASRTPDLMLRSAGAIDLFDCVVARHHVERTKPWPDLYLKAATALEVEPATCLVIEDSPVGVEAARAAGMRVIGISTTEAPEKLAGADAVVARFEEIDLGRWFGRWIPTPPR